MGRGARPRAGAVGAKLSWTLDLWGPAWYPHQWHSCFLFYAGSSGCVAEIHQYIY